LEVVRLSHTAALLQLTARAMPWSPLAVAAGVSVPAIVVGRLVSDGAPGPLAGAAAALLVVAGCAGLIDGARETVRAAPIAAWRRAASRLVLAVPAVCLAVIAVEMTMRLLFSGHGAGIEWMGLGALGASTITGVVIAARTSGNAAAAAVITVAGGWVLVVPMLSSAGVVGAVAAPWAAHPLVLTGVAVPVLAWGLLAGVES